METDIKALTEEMLVKQQTHIVLDSSQASKSSPVTFSSIENGSVETLKQAHEEDISVNCDYFNFKCVNEELMISHSYECRTRRKSVLLSMWKIFWDKETLENPQYIYT